MRWQTGKATGLKHLEDVGSNPTRATSTTCVDLGMSEPKWL